MHNCKATKVQLIEAAMGQSRQSTPEQEEFERCPACREELVSLRGLLRITDQAIESTTPPEKFWPGYHARLQQALERESSPAFRPTVASGRLVRLRKLFTTSIRVPVPLAAVLIIFFGLSIVYATQLRRRSVGILNPAMVVTKTEVTKTIEVPVIQERTVTKVVYRDRKPRINSYAPRPDQLARTRLELTGKTDEPAANTPISLVGFKPTSDPKLTIIKGSYRDEK